MNVIIGITGLKEHINVGRILQLGGLLFKVLSEVDCEIEGQQGQQMLCQLITI